MAALMDEMADLVQNGAPTSPTRRTENSVADLESAAIEVAIGSDRPVAWISELVGTYLFEGVRELLALGHLLRAEEVTGTIEVLVRAIVERVGRINWILDNDPRVTPKIRAVRATLEMNASSEHYRRALEDLGQSGRVMKPVIDTIRDGRALAEGWFTNIEKPTVDPGDSMSPPSSDVSKWIIEGESYPTYQKLARWAVTGEEFSGRVALGTYGALSSFSHPSFIASREHREVVEQRITYSYSFDYVERLIRLALFGLANAFKHWLSYYDVEHDTLVAHLDQIAASWEALTSDA
jgi:hypothetical protein